MILREIFVRNTMARIQYVHIFNCVCVYVFLVLFIRELLEMFRLLLLQSCLVLTGAWYNVWKTSLDGEDWSIVNANKSEYLKYMGWKV